jgi:hypothetical protein
MLCRRTSKTGSDFSENPAASILSRSEWNNDGIITHSKTETRGGKPPQRHFVYTKPKYVHRSNRYHGGVTGWGLTVRVTAQSHTYYVYQTPRSRALLENPPPLVITRSKMKSNLHTFRPKLWEFLICPICGTRPAQLGTLGLLRSPCCFDQANQFLHYADMSDMLAWKQSVTFCCAHCLYACSFFFRNCHVCVLEILYLYLRYVISAFIGHLDELSELQNNLLTSVLTFKSLLLFYCVETNRCEWISHKWASLYILLSPFGITAASTERNEELLWSPARKLCD